MAIEENKIPEKVQGAKPVSETVITTKVDVFEKKLPDGVVEKDSVVTTTIEKHRVSSFGWLWVTIGLIIALIIVLAGIIFFGTQYSRSVIVTSADHKTVIGGDAASGAIFAVTSTLAGNGPTTTATAINIPTGTFSSYLVVPQVPVDTAAYDTKIFALAHLAEPGVPVSSTLVAVGTASGTRYISMAVEAKRYWPVSTTTAPYPDAGAILPFDRIVAYYGNFYSTAMGVLGQYPEDQVLAMLASTTAAWQAADPSTPVIPGIDYIAVTAQGSPGADGMYRLRMPASQIEKAIAMAQSVHGVVILDVQVGWSTAQKEVPLLAPYLALPEVQLALDPEFSLSTLHVPPGKMIGTMDASDINWAAQFLANIVREDNLPPKILIVHRFTQAMVTNASEIEPLPEVQIVMDMDGFGTPAEKFKTYQDYILTQPVQFTGMKLFYYNDSAPTIGGHLLQPSEVLKLSPQPSFIQYQ